MSTPLPQKRKDWLPPPRAARTGDESSPQADVSPAGTSLPPPRQNRAVPEAPEQEDRRPRPPFHPPGAARPGPPSVGVSPIRKILGVATIALFGALIWYLTREIPKAAALEEATQASAGIMAQRLWVENGFVPELAPVSPLLQEELADLPRLFSEIRKNLSAQPRIDVMPSVTTGLWECNYYNGPEKIAVVKLKLNPETGTLSFLSASADPRMAKPFAARATPDQSPEKQASP